MAKKPGIGVWIKNIADIAVIVLIVLAAKTAIAEPFYVPSGSMEPTLLIGDELLATKYPYGYSAASLPSFVVLPNTPRVLAALPKRGDVVVFRWPGDRSQVWVKRVIGLPGDRISLRNGRVSINGTPVGIRPGGIGQAEIEDGSAVSAARYIETLPGGYEHPIFKTLARGELDDMPDAGRAGRSAVCHGRQSRQLGRQPRSRACGRRRTFAGRRPCRARRRRRRLLGSRCQTAGHFGMAFRLAAVALLHGGALSAPISRRRKYSTACAAAA